MLKNVCYADLLYLWNQGKKNGALNRLGYLKRGLFSAALEYCKMMGKIAHPWLIEVIEGIAELIRNTVGQKIFRRGINRASAMIQNTRLMKIFPSLSKWIKSDAFVFWLGTDLLFQKDSWIWFRRE
jgi:hypothetical protein